MSIEVTPEAAEVLRRSLELSKLEGGGVRLRAATGLGGGVAVQVELAAGPSGDETTTEAHGVTIFVDPSVTAAFPNALVTVDPQHDRIVVRPVEDEP
jgi:Fe-S cluster assembly iron-binding protein IscA